MRTMSRGWGFPIDYAATIAAEEARIRALESPEAALVSAYLDTLSPAVRQHVRTVGDFILSATDSVTLRAAMVGVGGDDLLAWLVYALDDCPTPESFDGWDDERTAVMQGWYARGKAVDERIAWIPAMTTAERKTEIRREKASLARHKRNRERHTS